MNNQQYNTQLGYTYHKPLGGAFNHSPLNGFTFNPYRYTLPLGQFNTFLNTTQFNSSRREETVYMTLMGIFVRQLRRIGLPLFLKQRPMTSNYPCLVYNLIDERLDSNMSVSNDTNWIQVETTIMSDQLSEVVSYQAILDQHLNAFYGEIVRGTLRMRKQLKASPLADGSDGLIYRMEAVYRVYTRRIEVFFC
jgi:hypothetical protein